MESKPPLWMPQGSVRSLLALAVVGAFIAGFIEELELVMLVLGFYFADRTSGK
jgi:RsiW-degrading membrane proteinase PrsW (M82 family)